MGDLKSTMLKQMQSKGMIKPAEKPAQVTSGSPIGKEMLCAGVIE